MPYRWPVWQSAFDLLLKLWPALLGAWVALQFHPPEASGKERWAFYASSVAVAVLFGPLFTEYFEVESAAVAVAVHGALGIFGLVIVGQLMAVLKHKWTRGAIRKFILRLFGGAS